MSMYAELLQMLELSDHLDEWEVPDVTTVPLPPTTYRPCPTCQAPIVSPFPADWTFDLVKEGPREGPVTSFGTPHRATCDQPVADPQPGIAVRVAGEYVADLNIHPF